MEASSALRLFRRPAVRERPLPHELAVTDFDGFIETVLDLAQLAFGAGTRALHGYRQKQVCPRHALHRPSRSCRARLICMSFGATESPRAIALSFLTSFDQLRNVGPARSPIRCRAPVNP